MSAEPAVIELTDVELLRPPLAERPYNCDGYCWTADWGARALLPGRPLVSCCCCCCWLIKCCCQTPAPARWPALAPAPPIWLPSTTSMRLSALTLLKVPSIDTWHLYWPVERLLILSQTSRSFERFWSTCTPTTGKVSFRSLGVYL